MNELTLGDALEELIDYRGKTPRKLATDFTESGVPVASALLVSNGTLNLADARTVSLDTYQSWMKTKTRKGDVLLTSEAPLGRVARVPSDDPLVLGQRLFGLRGRSGVLDNGYLFYALQTKNVQADLVGRSSGTTVLGIRQSALRQIKISAPKFEDQQAIAEVLGALDDKIAANVSLAAKAETLGKALFLEAISGPEAVRVQLRDVAKNSAGKYLAKEEYVTDGPYFVYGSNSIMGKHDKALHEGGFAVLAKIGSYCGNLRWSQRPAWINNNASAIIPLRGVTPSILRHAVDRMDMAPHRAGTGQPYIRMESLFSADLMVPEAEVAAAITPVLENLSEVEARTEEENETLAFTRNALLPALMSGKLQVKDAERALEDAGV